MKKALLCGLLALGVVSCGEDGPVEEPLPVAQGELLSVPCEAPRLTLEVRITTTAPVEAWSCEIGQPSMRCYGYPARIDSEWQGKIQCDQPPDYTSANLYCKGKAASDGRLVEMNHNLSPGDAPNYNGNDYLNGCPPP